MKNQTSVIRYIIKEILYTESAEKDYTLSDILTAFNNDDESSIDADVDFDDASASSTSHTTSSTPFNLNDNPAKPVTLNGVEYEPGVIASESANEFIKRFRDELDKNVKLHINSLFRDPHTEAWAMFKKWKLGGDEEIRKVYSTIIEDQFVAVLDKERAAGKTDAEIASIPDDIIPKIEKMITDLQTGGKAFHSGHMIGHGMDIRIRDLNEDQIKELLRAAKAAGAQKIGREINPPHVHVEF